MNTENTEQVLAVLTDQEISQLRIKMGKSHRTQKDWAYIRELLQDKLVFTAEPIKEEYREQCSIKGILDDGNQLMVFSSISTCQDYFEQYGSARFGYDLTIGCVPFTTVIMIATDHHKKVLFDMNCPQNGNVLGFDGNDRTLRSVKVKS